MIKSIDFPYEFTPFQKSYLTQTLFIKKLKHYQQLSFNYMFIHPHNSLDPEKLWFNQAI